MTFEQSLTRTLIEHGLFEDQAEVVMKMVKQDEVTKSMAGRWNHLASNYPDTMFSVLWLTVKRCALAWINENVPQAWYRPLFEDGLPSDVTR